MRLLVALCILLFAAGASAQETYTQTVTEAPLQNVNQTGVPLNLGDDNTRLIPLGFSFTMYGITYDAVYVSSNGFLSFTTQANGCCQGNPLPSTFTNSIFGLWTDLNGSGSGNPYYFTSPEYFTAGWYNTAEFGTNNRFNFEISLFPNNDIQISYGSMGNLSRHIGTAGIQGQNDFIQIYRGNTFSTLSGLSYLFSTQPVVPLPVDCNNLEMITDPSCIQNLLSSTLPPVTELPAYRSEPEQVVETPLETLLAVEQPASEKESAVEVNVLDIALAVASAPTTQVKTSNNKSSSQSSTSSDETKQTEIVGLTPESVSGDQQSTFGSQKEDSSSTGSSEDLFAFTGIAGIGNVSFLPPNPKNDSAATLEAIGVLRPQQERAEQTENTSPGLYPDQDQGAVLADINSNKGFDSYTSSTLVDASAWYKPEDIYKNNKIGDNKRGMYFLEKGSTDTYKRMVEDQYK